MNVETTRRETNRLLRALEQIDLVNFSLDWEEATGFDSIPTIREHYEDECVIPGCDYFRTSPIEMWFHVHLSRKHLRDDKTLLANLHHWAMLAHGLEIDDQEPVN